MNPSSLNLLTNPLKGTEVSTVVEIFTLLTLLSFAPLVLMTVTSFTRIVVVLSFLRQALGTQQVAVEPDRHRAVALYLVPRDGTGVAKNRKRGGDALLQPADPHRRRRCNARGSRFGNFS